MPATLPELTERQRLVFEIVIRHIRDHGLPPTVREVAVATGMRINGARGHLRLLARKGYVELVPGSARGIRLAAPFWCRCCGGSGIDIADMVSN